MYKIFCCMDCDRENVCVIELDNNTVLQLSAQQWFMVILEGLKGCGYVDKQQVTGITLEPCLKEF